MSNGIKSNQGYPYEILAVGGANFNTTDDVQAFFQKPDPPDNLAAEMPNVVSGGTPAAEMPNVTPGHMNGTNADFKRCVDYAEENGLNAVLVQAIPTKGDGELLVNNLPTVIYLDPGGNEVHPEGAPSFGPTYEDHFTAGTIKWGEHKICKHLTGCAGYIPKEPHPESDIKEPHPEGGIDGPFSDYKPITM